MPTQKAENALDFLFVLGRSLQNECFRFPNRTAYFNILLHFFEIPMLSDRVFGHRRCASNRNVNNQYHNEKEQTSYVFLSVFLVFDESIYAKIQKV